MLYSFENNRLAKLAESRQRVHASSDPELLTEVAAGTEAALDELITRHRALIRTVIARIVNDVGDVDEIFQETLLDVWNKADHYSRQKVQAIAWIITIARRRAIDRVRRRQTYSRIKERFSFQEKVIRDEVDSHTAQTDAAADDLRRVIEEVLKTLPDAQREVLSLNIYARLSQRQIAAKIHAPLGTTKTRLELAIRKVRTAILARAPRTQWMQELTT